MAYLDRNQLKVVVDYLELPKSLQRPLHHQLEALDHWPLNQQQQEDKLRVYLEAHRSQLQQLGVDYLGHRLLLHRQISQ